MSAFGTTWCVGYSWAPLLIASLTRKPVGFMQSCCCHSRSGSQGCFLRENDGDNIGDDRERLGTTGWMMGMMGATLGMT